MDPEAFRRHGHAIIDWIADYLAHPERHAVLSSVEPGAIARALPAEAPARGEPFEAILADVERVLVPGLTHWNHPGFLAYFSSSAPPPAILAELLAAALNQQAMLWRTSPAATELERVALGWLRQLLGLPDTFSGVIFDTASIATLHALIAARHAARPDVRVAGLAGRPDLPAMRVYTSAESHMSVDKAAIAIGLGTSALRHIEVDEELRMRPDALARAITEDRAAGRLPLAIVATVGTTSTTSIDPVAPIAEIAAREGIWLHVDAAYGGAAAILPSHAWILDGADRADSLVMNPHKWLFTPFDLSAFYCRRPEVLREALSIAPEYLKTADAAENLMDTGLPLGRRFRALKLWMVMRSYGTEGLRALLAAHIRLAQLVAGWVDADGDFERLAPVPLSVVCFRWKPADRPMSDDALDEANLRLLDAVNAVGDVFLSHTRVNGRIALRIAIGHYATTDAHVARAWALLKASAGTI